MKNDARSPVETTAQNAGQSLNHACYCMRVDEKDLARALEQALGSPAVSAMVRERCPHLFAAQPVFAGGWQLQRMAAVVRAVESVVALPAYRAEVLASAPAIARHAPAGPKGVFFGYDFHLNQGRLALIEVNTNAGGAMLNAVLAKAQRGVCPAIGSLEPSLDTVENFERQIVAMFQHEWELAGKNAQPLRTIAIVDAAPESQYLFAEFLLFKRLFEQSGLQVVIAAPETLQCRQGALWCGDLAIDLVYNRLTDFYLQGDNCAALREAFLSNAVVLTPDPQAHALYADKRRLVVFSDDQKLQALGADADTRAILMEHGPKTEEVSEVNAQRLWEQRRDWFFKPVAGFGGKGSYRGAKLTKRVWQDILDSDYVAQELVAPGDRSVRDSGNSVTLKFDLRAYAYDAVVQWFAARLYQGQTTNFRTHGGGFAPVYGVGDSSASRCGTDPTPG